MQEHVLMNEYNSVVPRQRDSVVQGSTRSRIGAIDIIDRKVLNVRNFTTKRLDRPIEACFTDTNVIVYADNRY
jgi:hypothetical protein